MYNLCYTNFTRLGKTPITKNVSVYSVIVAGGGTPIIKNITVIDEQGNFYEATYPKRAHGLVKRGRVYFVDATTICLISAQEMQASEQTDKHSVEHENNLHVVCSPNTYLEDIMMENNECVQETAVIDTTSEPELSMAYVLKAIETLMEQATSSFVASAQALPSLVSMNEAPEQFLDNGEDFYRDALKLLGRIYDDIKSPQTISVAAWKVQQLKEIIQSTNWVGAPDVLPAHLTAMLGQALELELELE